MNQYCITILKTLAEAQANATSGDPGFCYRYGLKDATGLSYDQVNREISFLQKDGLISDTWVRDEGDVAIVFRITEKGLQALKDLETPQDAPQEQRPTPQVKRGFLEFFSLGK